MAQMKNATIANTVLALSALCFALKLAASSWHF